MDISDIGKVILDLDSSVCYLSDTSADLDAIHIKSEKFSMSNLMLRCKMAASSCVENGLQ